MKKRAKPAATVTSPNRSIPGCFRFRSLNAWLQRPSPLMRLSIHMNAPTPRKKLLLVDDDPSILKLLAVVLENFGYEVHTAHNALPALFAVARTDPDLVLADLDMPIMDGFGLIRQLK